MPKLITGRVGSGELVGYFLAGLLLLFFPMQMAFFGTAFGGWNILQGRIRRGFVQLLLSILAGGIVYYLRAGSGL